MRTRYVILLGETLLEQTLFFSQFCFELGQSIRNVLKNAPKDNSSVGGRIAQTLIVFGQRLGVFKTGHFKFFAFWGKVIAPRPLILFSLRKRFWVRFRRFLSHPIIASVSSVHARR